MMCLTTSHWKNGRSEKAVRELRGSLEVFLFAMRNWNFHLPQSLQISLAYSNYCKWTECTEQSCLEWQETNSTFQKIKEASFHPHFGMKWGDVPGCAISRSFLQHAAYPQLPGTGLWSHSDWEGSSSALLPLGYIWPEVIAHTLKIF